MPAKDLTVVVPVLNEAQNIEPLVDMLRAALDGLEWEVSFVDDDSPDGTARVASALAREDARVRLILRVDRPGLANSCIQGMLSSTADVLCVMDGDGQHDPMLILDMLKCIEHGEADVVSAARDLAAVDDRAMSPARRRLSHWGNVLCGIVLRRTPG